MMPNSQSEALIGPGGIEGREKGSSGLYVDPRAVNGPPLGLGAMAISG